MENNNLVKIVILDSTAAHGQYISKMFINDCILMTSNYEQSKLSAAAKDATLIYVLSFYEELKELEFVTKSHFQNVVICSELLDDSLLKITKPFVFVSLNGLKDKWMEGVFQALLDLNGPEILPYLSSDHTTYKSQVHQID